MYDGDSFFTLTPGGQTGLVLLSGLLVLLMGWLVWRLARQRRLVWRVAIWALAVVGFEWLSPQIYYFYYLALFDGLPVQVVIGPWPDLAAVGEVLLFREATLSGHGRAALALLLLAVALAAGLDRRGGAFHQEGQRGQGRTP